MRKLGRKHLRRAVDPLVVALIIEITERKVSMESVSLTAGLGKNTIGTWSEGRRTPNIANMRAALGALGLVLVAITPNKA